MSQRDIDSMLQRYQYLVQACAKGFGPAAQRDEDALQCGMIGLWEACRNWDGKRPFPPFARRCIKCNMIDYFRRKKDLQYPMMEDLPVWDKDIGDDRAYLLSVARAVLRRGSRELAVLRGLLSGKSKAQLARKLGVSKRTVQRLAVRAWRLTKAELDKEE